MSLKPIYVAIVFATVCLSLTAAQDGQNPQQPSGKPTELLMRDAARLIADGNFGAAETFYNTILQRDPDNKQARLARGHVRAWQHKYDEAREDFLAILRLDPNNLSALNGLGYSFAWASAYDEAEKRFRQSLAVAPGQLEASKGLAYVALWRGDAKETVRRFQALSAQAPHDAEIQVGLGQAYLAAGQRRNAHKAFERAQQIEPTRKDAKEGREATRFRNPVVEVTVWGGNTQFQKNGTSDTGIRFAEVAILPTRNTRAWFQSDNGLSLDNLALVQANQEVHTYYVGGLLNWRQHYTTRLEAGWRELPGKISQRIVRGEQVFSLSRSHALRAGAWVGPREDGRTEWVANVGVIAPVREPFRLESTFFYSRSGLASERQWRLLLAGEYSLPKGWRMGGGLAGGKATTLAGGRNNLWDGFLSASAPLGQFGRARVLFRRETPGGGNAITVFAVGYSLYLPGR
jgi:Flp pilus assembly protein TadD